MNLPRIEHYISRLTPNAYPLNALLIAPHFYRVFRRLPRKPSRHDADFHDFIVDRMARNGWSDLHLKCVDKEYAKQAALEAAPDVRVPATIEIIPTPRGISIDYLRERLKPHVGKRLVAKPTQGSGVVIFLDDMDERKLVTLFRATRYDYFYRFRETQYRGLKSKVIVEENIATPNTDCPDYKFFCARGSVLFAQIDSDRFVDHRRILLFPPSLDEPTKDLRLGPFEAPSSWRKPESLSEMVVLANLLSKPFDFVRIDLYSTEQGIFFGEFTFTPAAGMEPFSNAAFSRELLMTIAPIINA